MKSTASLAAVGIGGFEMNNSNNNGGVVGPLKERLKRLVSQKILLALAGDVAILLGLYLVYRFGWRIDSGHLAIIFVAMTVNTLGPKVVQYATEGLARAKAQGLVNIPQIPSTDSDNGNGSD